MDLVKSSDETPSIAEVKELIVNIFEIDADEWPEDKEIEIKVNFMVVPENVTFKVTKK